jgi:hypothetical protein
MQRCKPGRNIWRCLSRRYPKKSMSNFRIASTIGLSVGFMLVLNPVLLNWDWDWCDWSIWSWSFSICWHKKSSVISVCHLLKFGVLVILQLLWLPEKLGGGGSVVVIWFLIYCLEDHRPKSNWNCRNSLIWSLKFWALPLLSPLAWAVLEIIWTPISHICDYMLGSACGAQSVCIILTLSLVLGINCFCSRTIFNWLKTVLGQAALLDAPLFQVVYFFSCHIQVCVLDSLLVVSECQCWQLLVFWKKDTLYALISML